MWIRRANYQYLVDRIAELVATTRDQAALLVRTSAELREAQQTAVSMRERRSRAEAEARSAKTMTDLWTIRVNQLQHERDTFLQKLFDPSLKVELQTPHVGMMPVIQPPGISFEDLGDAAAAQHGYDVSLPADAPASGEELGGLIGDVYNPADSDAGSPVTHEPGFRE